ncbi:unnamed protein product, partial [Aureobasidium mustum]
MQFWNWFVLANAAMVMAKPCEKHCMRQETKHFNIEEAPLKRVCKKKSIKILKFWKWMMDDFGPCMRDQCEHQDRESKITPEQ